MSQDTSIAPFKAWLRNRLKRAKRDTIDALTKRILDDTRLPTKGSHSLYLAHLRAKGYSSDDIKTFESAWTEMKSQENNE